MSISYLRFISAVDTREGWGLGWKWDGLRELRPSFKSAVYKERCV